jgi:hypothetical protein
MKRLLFVALLCAVATGAFAQTDEGVPTQTGGFGIGKALADSLYCALSGCTMSGAITFNGSKVQTGGANILNIANGTNAQSLRVYNTDDGAGNAEYGGLDWQTTANVLLSIPSRPAQGHAKGRDVSTRRRSYRSVAGTSTS